MADREEETESEGWDAEIELSSLHGLVHCALQKGSVSLETIKYIYEEAVSAIHVLPQGRDDPAEPLTGQTQKEVLKHAGAAIQRAFDQLFQEESEDESPEEEQEDECATLVWGAALQLATYVEEQTGERPVHTTDGDIEWRGRRGDAKHGRQELQRATSQADSCSTWAPSNTVSREPSFDVQTYHSSEQLAECGS